MQYKVVFKEQKESKEILNRIAPCILSRRAIWSESYYNAQRKQVSYKDALP